MLQNVDINAQNAVMLYILKGGNVCPCSNSELLCGYHPQSSG